MSQIQFVELHQSDTDHCKMDPTLVAHLENGTKVILVGLTAEQLEAMPYEEAKSAVEAAVQAPWDTTGRCCGSYKADVWTRQL